METSVGTTKQSGKQMISIPGYEFSTVLHEGISTIIVQGHRIVDDMPVVAKLLRSEYPRPRDLARLRHEFGILRQLNVPNVIKAYSIEKYGNGIVLILEGLTAKALSEHIHRKTLDLGTSLRIALTLAEILAELHKHRITHKDIKPQNVLLEEATGKVYLIDFGVASHLSQETQNSTPAHALEGTLAYMSPEQTGRMNRSIDHRTDYYSLGVTLYEMLVGSLPFVSTDPVELVHQHIAVTPVAPHQRNPRIPQVVSDLVMKLLAKAAESRYQNAAGIVADLKECLSQWNLHGTVFAFPLGRHDISDTPQIPQKLYGRERHVAALMGAFERVSSGRSELLLVGGPSGVGKSVLIQEVNQAIARQGGDFVSGKFDQLHRTLPFAAFTQAFRELVRHLLMLPEAQLGQWRSRLATALGANAQLIIDLIPELEFVLGPQPPVATLGPTEAQLRFGLVMQNYVRVFCTAGHPVVLFLDDLQWADPASLWLLQLLLTDAERGHLLIVGAYRDNEVDAAHPLRATIQQLRKHDVETNEVTLEPLALEDVQLMLAETFGQHAAGPVDSLARQVHAKTQGNPFFIIQFLSALHKAGLLYLDLAISKWTWDVARIAAAPLTDNVVEFMSGQIQKLPVDTQRLLAQAACIGFQFGLSTLVNIAERAPLAVSAALWPALGQGLLLPTSSEYRLVPGQEDVDGTPAVSDIDLNVSYRFLHDRVQQAAYSLIPEEQRPALHLRIGRGFRQNLPSTPRAEVVFEVVHHLNAGASCMTEPAERIDLARLNLQAGRMAKAATAYSAAADFFGAGVAQLDASIWETDYELAFDLHRDQAECEYLAGRFAKAESLLAQLLGRVSSNLQRTEILGLRMMLYASQGRFEEGVTAGREGLKLLGIDLPVGPADCFAALMAEIGSIDKILGAGSITSLVDAPLLTAKDKQAALRLMMDLSPLAYQAEPSLFAVVVAKQVSLSLTFGHASISAYGYVTYGIIMAGAFGRYAEAIALGHLSLLLVEKLHGTEVACRVNACFGFYAPYGEPLRSSIGVFTRAQQIGLESGDYYYASLAFLYVPLTLLRLGDSLDTVRDEVSRGLTAMKRTQDQTGLSGLQLIRQVIACLQGQTESPTSFNSAEFDVTQWLAHVDAMKLGGMRCLYQIYLLQVCYLHGRYQEALAMAEGAERLLGAAVGLHYSTDHPFYTALALAAQYDTAPEEQRPAQLAAMSVHLATLERLKQGSSTNEAHRHALVAAEIHRVSGEPTQAMALYEQAIALARDNGFPHHEALANELFSKFHLTQGNVKAASEYMTKARYDYERWGASVKVAQLTEQYTQQFSVPEVAPGPSREPLNRVTDTTTTMWMSGQSLDVVSVLRASQAISSEIVLTKVLDRVMRVVVASAGAQRGFLVLKSNDSLWVEALIVVDPERVEVGLHTPVASRADLAATIIQYVARSHETVVISDATTAPRFASDPYIARERPKSILCLALLHQGRLVGIVYLENNVSTNVFTHERVELLRLISSQAAISVENAQLYSNLQEATEKLKQSNENLEQQVAQRTSELSKALNELWSEMDLARKIQTVLLPTEATISGYEVTAIMRPAATVGGDYYDIFQEAGSDWLLIGDVSGHGVSAGLCMMMVQTAVRAVARTLQSQPNRRRPAEVLTLVNSAIHRNLSEIGKDHYMTISAFSFQENRILYAGLHQDILVFRAAKRQIERIETRGVWLGVLPSLEGLLFEDQLELAPDDVMILFTDGVTEASIGKRRYLQTDGLESMLQEVIPTAQGTAQIVDFVLQRLKAYTVKDDITLIAVKKLRDGKENHA